MAVCVCVCVCDTRKKNKIGIIFDFRTFSRHFIELLETTDVLRDVKNVDSSVVYVFLLSTSTDYANYDEIRTLDMCVCVCGRGRARFFSGFTAATAHRK